MAWTINLVIGLDPALLKLLQGSQATVNSKLDLILANQAANQEKIMASLDDIATDVTEEGTTIDGLGALFTGLQQQIADALAGVTLPPVVQAKIDSIWAGTQANKAKFATALAANVPPAAA